MKLVISLTELIELGIIGFFIFGFIISFIIGFLKAKYDSKFKKNCFKCKYYKLDDVASFGDKCWYRCHKHNRVDDHTMNCSYNFIKCDDYEEVDKNA